MNSVCWKNFSTNSSYSGSCSASSTAMRSICWLKNTIHAVPSAWSR